MTIVQTVFTASGTFTPPAGVTSVDVLLVGGGGSGGKGNLSTTLGGGGGAGGVKEHTAVAVTPGVGVTVTVGAGGAAQATNLTDGNSGGGSAFGALSVSGGGGGGAGSSTTSTANAVAPSGGASGGGGGCSSSSTGSPFAGGNSISGQGHNGGSGIGQLSPSDGRNAGGGGGAGAAGTNGTSGNTTPFTQWMGHGGAGVDLSATYGTSVGVAGKFGGGGGGGTSQAGAAPQPSGGVGGGGVGAQPSVAPGAGVANTGGGGGGSGSNFSSGAGGSGVVIVRYNDSNPPGVPTAVTATPTVDTIQLAWSAPATGGAPTSYEVRLNGGSASTATSPHDFTGLTDGTSYTVSVRAVNADGASSWVDTVVSTLIYTPPGYYRVELEAGPYSWNVERGDTPGYGVMLPLTLGWDMPDGEEFYPTTPNMPTMVFQLLVQDASDLVDLVEGSTVSFGMFLSADPAADPWQQFSGVVTQLVGETVAGEGDTLDFLVTVYAADNLMRLASMVIGYTVDWPIELIGDRVDRIAAEAGLTVSTPFSSGLEGWLAARSKRPTTVLQALRDAMKDTAVEDSSGGPSIYGCFVPTFVPADSEIVIYPLLRQVYAGEENVVHLDGANVFAPSARWAKLRGTVAATWGLVDTTVFGTPDSSTPFWRSTSLLDYFGPGGTDPNYSATMRDRIGESLLATSSTQLDGWHARTLRLDTAAAPEGASGLFVGAAGLASDPQGVAVSVVVTPLKAELEVEGEDYLAGTLVGARLTLPPGGDHYVELSLRAEVLDGVTLP